MKKVFGCLLTALFVFTANGQMVYFGTGKTISDFEYKNSKGTSLNNLYGSNHNSLCLGLRYSLFQTACNLSCDATYNEYGAKGSDATLGNYYQWDVTYLGANLGVDYEFFKPHFYLNEQNGLSFYLKASVASEFLLDGIQNLNNQLYNLSGVKDFDKPLYFIRGGVGLNYYLSKEYVIFLQYLGGRSFLIGNYENKGQLHIVTNNISVGLSINLAFRDY